MPEDTNIKSDMADSIYWKVPCDIESLEDLLADYE